MALSATGGKGRYGPGPGSVDGQGGWPRPAEVDAGPAGRTVAAVSASRPRPAAAVKAATVVAEAANPAMTPHGSRR